MLRFLYNGHLHSPYGHQSGHVHLALARVSSPTSPARLQPTAARRGLHRNGHRIWIEMVPTSKDGGGVGRAGRRNRSRDRDGDFNVIGGTAVAPPSSCSSTAACRRNAAHRRRGFPRSGRPFSGLPRCAVEAAGRPTSLCSNMCLPRRHAPTPAGKCPPFPTPTAATRPFANNRVPLRTTASIARSQRWWPWDSTNGSNAHVLARWQLREGRCSVSWRWLLAVRSR